MGSKDMKNGNLCADWIPIPIDPLVVLDDGGSGPPPMPPPPPPPPSPPPSLSEASPPLLKEYPLGEKTDFLSSLLVVLLVSALIFIPLRGFLRFFPFFFLCLHRSPRASAMIIAMRWLDLYERQRVYGESILEFAIRLEEELNLKCFREMAENRRREFTYPNNSREGRSYWTKKLKELRNTLENHKNLRSPKKFCRDVLWKVFGFPDYPPNVQNTNKARGANQ